jgi:hypothetical protein
MSRDDQMHSIEEEQKIKWQKEKRPRLNNVHKLLY